MSEGDFSTVDVCLDDVICKLSRHFPEERVVAVMRSMLLQDVDPEEVSILRGRFKQNPSSDRWLIHPVDRLVCIIHMELELAEAKRKDLPHNERVLKLLFASDHCRSSSIKHRWGCLFQDKDAIYKIRLLCCEGEENLELCGWGESQPEVPSARV